MATQVAFSDLNSWLQSQPANTPDTPYELKISGLTAGNVVDSAFGNSFGYIFKQNNEKYVDLSETIIPSSVTNGNSIFRNCETLVKSPLFPNSIIYFDSVFDGCINLKEVQNIPSNPADGKYNKGLQNTFRNCSSLISVPDFPDTVLVLDGVFYGCTSLVRAPKLPSNVTILQQTFLGCSSLQYAPEIPNSVTQLYSTFTNCSSLKNAPQIPNSVIYLSRTFSGCISLVNAPIIPDSVTNMDYAFDYCSSIAYKPIIPATVTTSTNCYRDVTTLNWKGTKSQAGLCPNDCEYQLYNNDRVTLEDTIYNVDISTLSTYLAGLDPNTVSAAYKIYIRGLTSSNVSDIQTALIANPTKFVDLTYTTIPSGTDCTDLFADCVTLTKSAVLDSNTTSLMRTFDGCSNLQEAPALPSALEDMTMCFRGCSSIVTPPTIPSTVAYLDECFKNCTSLTEAPILPSGTILLNGTFAGCSSLEEPPVIPSGVTNIANLFNGCTSLEETPDIPSGVTSIYKTFYGCTSIENVSSIPASVTNGEEAFSGCTSLQKIDEFNIPLATLKNNPDFQNMFAGCTSLTQIGFKVDSSTDWHVFSLSVGSSSIEGKVYGVNSNKQITTATIPSTSITKSSIRLPVLTDELWFPTGLTDSEIDDTILDMLVKRYGVFNKTVIDPRHKSFVLLADDPSYITTNITRGAVIKQAAFDAAHPVDEIYIQYPTQKAPADLYNVGGVRSTWEDITSEYDGAFFRAYKSGTSKSFADSTVNPNQLNTYKQDSANKSHNHGKNTGSSYAKLGSTASPSEASSFTTTSDGSHGHDVLIYTGGKSGISNVYGGSLIASNCGAGSSRDYQTNYSHNGTFGPIIKSGGSHSHRIYQGTHSHSISSDGETESRPQNFAIRIWKRTA